MSLSDPSPVGENYLPGNVDSAETFAESDVTVGHSNTKTENGLIRFQGPSIGSTTTIDSLHGSSTILDDRVGMVINTNTSMDGFDMVLEGNTSAGDVKYTRLRDLNDNIIYEVTGFPANGELRYPIESGKDYVLELDMAAYGYSDSSSYPYSSTDLDATDGWKNGSTNTSIYAFESISSLYVPTSGSATVEWPYPNDVIGWGRSFFEYESGGGVADVYVEEYDGSSWVEIAGPISPGDDIPASPSRNVRFRFDVSRTLGDRSDPRLKQIHRQEVLVNA